MCNQRSFRIPFSYLTSLHVRGNLDWAKLIRAARVPQYQGRADASGNPNWAQLDMGRTHTCGVTIASSN